MSRAEAGPASSPAAELCFRSGGKRRSDGAAAKVQRETRGKGRHLILFPKVQGRCGVSRQPRLPPSEPRLLATLRSPPAPPLPGARPRCGPSCFPFPSGKGSLRVPASPFRRPLRPDSGPDPHK